MSRRTFRRAFGAVASATALGLTLLAAPQASGQDDRSADPSAAADGPAQRALAQAKGLFDGEKEPRGKGREATLVLRDLVAKRAALTGAERRTADRLLARPTDPNDPWDAYTVRSRKRCGTNVCVHFVQRSADAVSLRDTAPANGTPDYVDRVLATMERVHATYVGAGYRAPKPDGSRGGDAKTDIYLAQVGDEGLYGYCTSDEDLAQGQYDAWAYCVLDNDYRAEEFGAANTPLENMRVTAAHEYFHAVQFGYDYFEDGWFMEATATWAEDEVFDDVNDNLFYLKSGQLRRPRVPLDKFADLNVYGNWIFFRYLTENVSTAEEGAMPTLVRTMWQHADSIDGAADEYSLQAVASALAEAGKPIRTAYSDFAAANRRPVAYYEEAGQLGYPVAPLSVPTATLTPGQNTTGWRAVTQDHLTHDTARFRPSDLLSGRAWKLRLAVDMADARRGSSAVATVFAATGTSTVPVPLNVDGDGSVRLPFSSSDVRRVELTLVNASTRTACWTRNSSPFSCLGTPRDENLEAKYRAVAFR